VHWVTTHRTRIVPFSLGLLMGLPRGSCERSLCTWQRRRRSREFIMFGIICCRASLSRHSLGQYYRYGIGTDTSQREAGRLRHSRECSRNRSRPCSASAAAVRKMTKNRGKIIVGAKRRSEHVCAQRRHSGDFSVTFDQSFIPLCCPFV
jgi:hypothetical protein